MNQPLSNSIRSSVRYGGATLSNKASGLWAVLLTALCLFGMTMPSQAQGFFTISQSPANGGTITEGTGGTRTIFFRIQLFGGVSGQTYRIHYQAQSGPILVNPQKPNATSVTGCDAFSLNDFDGSPQQADFPGATNNNFKDLGITINADDYDEGNSSLGSPYFSQEFFKVILQSVENVTATPVGPTPLVGTDPDPAVKDDSDQVEAIIVDDDSPSVLTVRQIADQGPQTITRSDGFTDRDYPDSFFPEGATGQNNTVRLYVTGDRVSGKQIQFRWRTFSGTATQDTDYIGQDNIVTIPPNATISKLFNRGAGACNDSQTPSPAVQLTIPIIGDVVDEADETFVVDLRDPNGVYPSNAFVTGGSAQDGTSGFAVTGTIKDDDAPSVTINDTQVTEGDAGTTNATFQVKLSSTSPQSVRVDYVTDLQLFNSGIPNGSAVPYIVNGLPADYQYDVGKVIFQPGETTKFISIKVNGDIIPEGESSANRFETFPVDLFIGNNGLENNLQPNSAADLNDTLGVSLTDAEGIAQINDDDTLSQLAFKSTANSASGDVIVDEGDLDPASGQPKQQIASFVVTLDKPSGLPVSVTYATSDGTAIDGVGDPVTATNPADYQATTSTITFNPGETQQVVTHVENDQFGNPVTKTGVVVFGDVIDETDETFFVSLSNANNATVLDTQAQATIKDDDGPFVSVNGGTINGVPQDNVSGPEGDTGTSPFNFTVSLSAPSPQTITVQLSTSDGSAVSTAPNPDFVPITNQTLTFLPGETSKVVTVNVNGDIADERNETFLLNIVSVTNAQDPNLVGGNGDSQAIGTIIDDDATPSIIIGDQNTTEGDSGTKNLNFTVQLSAPTFQNVSFNYTTADGTAKLSDNDYLASSGQLVIQSGSTTQSFSVPVVGDIKKEVDEDFFVNISNVVNADASSPVSDLQAIGTIVNDDLGPAGLTITPSTVTTNESGTTASFTVKLDRQPTADVSVQFTSSDTSEGLVSTGGSSPAASVTLTFTTANFNAPQTITVTGVDDTLVDGNINYLINSENAVSADPLYSGLNASDVSVTNVDDEVPGFRISPTKIQTTEGGGTATFTVRLNVAPTANVTIPLRSNDTTEGKLIDPATSAPDTDNLVTLTFTPGNFSTPQTVTVRGQDDLILDGNIDYVIITDPASSTDARYNLDPVDVDATNLDNDTPSIVVTPSGNLKTTEAGGKATFTVRLSTAPINPVRVPLRTSDATEGLISTATQTTPKSSSGLTFTPANYNAPQTVTVTGQDDAIDDGDVAYVIITDPAVSSDPAYNGLNGPNVSVKNIDNEDPEIRVSPTSLTTNENSGTASFTVVLVAKPTANVTIPVTSSNTGEGTVFPSSLVFTPTNYNTPQNVVITVVDDFVDDGDVTYTVLLGPATSTDAAYSGLSAQLPVTNVDNDTAGIQVTSASGQATTEAGGKATFTVVLTSQPTQDVTVQLSSSDTSEGTVSPASLVFTSANYNTPRTVTVTGKDDAVDDGDVAYKIAVGPAISADNKYNGLSGTSVSLMNTDDDTRGATITPVSGLKTTEARGKATFTIVLVTQPTADVRIPLRSTDISEGKPTVSSVTFTTANYATPQTVTIVGVNDFVDDGNVSYKIQTLPAVSADPVYKGFDAADVAVTNVDDDTAGVVIRPTTGLTTTEAGGTATFTIRLASEPTTSVTIDLSSNDTTEGTVSPTRIIFTPDVPPAGSPSNKVRYDTPVTITATGVDDAIEDGDVIYHILVSVTPSTTLTTDPNYTSLSVPDVVLQNLDNDDKAPSVAITTPTEGTAYDKLPQAQGTATDDVNGSGVAKVEVVVYRYADSSKGISAGYLQSDGTFGTTVTRLATTGSSSGGVYNWTFNLPALSSARYFVRAYATDKVGNISAPDTKTFRIIVSGGEDFTGDVTYYISIPYMDSSSATATTTPLKAFSVPPVDPTTNVQNYTLQRYNPQTLAWENIGNAGILRRGEGYRLHPLRLGTRIIRPSEDSSRKPLLNTIQEFQVTLRNNPSVDSHDASNGYNLIGDPFDPATYSAADFYNARVTATVNGQTFSGTVAQAANQQIVDSRLFTFDETTGNYTEVTGNLLPFKGYFVRTFVDGVQVDLKAIK